ncbi:hypothetical protein CHRYSEOSP005_01790 [Chryseobacterium sp. Alg-005]|uniref:META domain-containing protein n=1 Tax=Chryseobacterium sp. Alg-005 TaxID=3159516 RepID=UPI0035558414
MKKIIILFFPLIIVGIMGGCSPAQVKNPHIQREWMLISFKDFTKEQLVENKVGINLTDQKREGKIHGGAFMGCNKMFFTSEFKNNGKVKISGVRSTMMACQNMDLETAFTESFDKITRYSVEGHFLTLSGENGNIMKFVAADWD